MMMSGLTLLKDAPVSVVMKQLKGKAVPVTGRGGP
jgi:hypothetical protein